jgi:hypothetical protein
MSAPEEDVEAEREATSDLGYRDTDEERAYNERREPEDEGAPSADPEPDREPPAAS